MSQSSVDLSHSPLRAGRAFFEVAREERYMREEMSKLTLDIRGKERDVSTTLDGSLRIQ